MKVNRAILCTGLIFGLGMSSSCNAAFLEKSKEKLMQAVEKGDVKAAKRQLIFQKNEKSNSEHYRQTPLEKAIENNDVEMVKMLLKEGADVNASARTSESLPIIMAIENNNLDIVRLLVDKGATLNISSGYGHVPLKCAIDTKNLGIIRLLLENGANPNWIGEYDLEDSFMYAVRKSTLDVIKLLIEKGVNVNAKDQNDETALAKAIKAKRLDVIKLLVENGADVHRVLLCIAAAYCDIDTLLYLKSKGAKLLVRVMREESAYSAISNALEQKSIELLNFIFEQLQSEGIDLKECINQEKRGGNPLILKAVRLKFPEAVNFLLEKGADERAINGEDSQNNTALIYALKDNDVDMVGLLIDHGADVNRGYSETPLLWAAKNNSINMVKKLLEKGGDKTINKRSYDVTPLVWAIKHSNFDMVKLLLENGADSNTTFDEENCYDSMETVLTLAVEKGCKDIVRLLLEHGATESIHTPSVSYVRVSDNIYAHQKRIKETPLKIARERGRGDLVDLLKQYGAKE